MMRWLALALIGVLCLGCAERSSLFVENLSAQPVVVRVYFNSFGESFGFRVPAGVRAWGWAPLEGRVTGPIAVFDESCTIAWHQEIPMDGGHLKLDAGGAIELSAPEPPSPAPSANAFLEFTDVCAEAANPRR